MALRRASINRRAEAVLRKAVRLMAQPDRQGTRSMAIKARDNANMAIHARTDEGAAMFLTDALIYLSSAR